PTGEGWYRFPRHEAVGGEMVEGIARRFGFSRRWAEAVGTAVRLHMRPLQPPTPRAVRRFQAEAREHLPLLRAVCYADGEGRREDLEAWFRPQGVPLSPLLQGRDLLALGLEPGPRIGQLLRRASELQLELGLGSKDAVLEALRQEGLIP
ncbi:MAG: CCA tRNA nucleotidyltransferase, partial [Thermus sp.]